MEKVITDVNQINIIELGRFLEHHPDGQKAFKCLDNTLKHASRISVLKTGNDIKGFLSFVDDDEECLVHDFILDKHASQKQSLILCDQVLDYAREKKFLYTEIFSCPSTARQIFLQNNFHLAFGGMFFDKTLPQKSIIDQTKNLKISTDIYAIDTAGVNIIYDAVGWGGRSKEMWEKVLKNTSFSVQVSHNDRVIGFARIKDDHKRAMIYDVCVLPDYQKKNIGSILMGQICAYIRKNDFEFTGLVVVPENKSARKFYQKFGFVQASSVLQLARESIPSKTVFRQTNALSKVLNSSHYERS